jgi:hypothetical protein
VEVVVIRLEDREAWRSPHSSAELELAEQSFCSAPAVRTLSKLNPIKVCHNTENTIQLEDNRLFGIADFQVLITIGNQYFWTTIWQIFFYIPLFN